MARTFRRLAVVLASLSLVAGCASNGGSSASVAPSAVPSTAATSPSDPTASPGVDSWVPEEDITFIVPFPAGSAPDAQARVVALEMEKDLGVPVVVQNVEGGASTIGLLELATSDPDGTTIGLGTAGGNSVQRRLIDNPFEGPGTLTAVARISQVANVMYASPSRGWDSIETFVDAAKASEAPFTVGLGNKGSSQHIQTELFARAAGIELEPVYFDAGQMVLPAVNGTVHVSVSQFGPVVQYIEAGDLAYIGTFLPEPPDGVEVTSFVGAGYDVSTDYADYEGVFGPAGLPEAITARLSVSVERAIASDAYQEYAAGVFAVPAFLGYEDFAAQVLLTDEQAVQVIEELGLDQG